MSVVSLRCACPYFRTLISRSVLHSATPAASLWSCAGLFYIGRNLECGLTDGWCGVHFACAVSEMILTKLVQDHGSAPGWAAVCFQYIYERSGGCKCLYLQPRYVHSNVVHAPAGSSKPREGDGAGPCHGETNIPYSSDTDVGPYSEPCFSESGFSIGLQK